MNEHRHFAFTLFAIATAAACSPSRDLLPGNDGGDVAPTFDGGRDVPLTDDTGDEPTDDAGREVVDARRNSTFGDPCSASEPCSDPGYACVERFDVAGPFCAKKCQTTEQCPPREDCESGRCVRKCVSTTQSGCPHKFVCGDLDLETWTCIPDCRVAGFSCKDGRTCHPVVGQCSEPPPPPPPQCQPSSGANASGVPQASVIGGLSDAAKGQLCDFAAGLWGGYGCTVPCDGGLALTFSKDVATCKSRFKPTCTATVADYEACMKLDAADRCAGRVFADPACAPLRDASCM